MKHQITGILFSSLAATCLAADQAPKPDILLIMPDQMRGDCMSILGHPAVRTLNLDELAQQGALFRRAYATVPSCIPARYALLTGIAPQTSGVVGFAAKPFSAPPLPELPPVWVAAWAIVVLWSTTYTSFNICDENVTWSRVAL